MRLDVQRQLLQILWPTRLYHTRGHQNLLSPRHDALNPVLPYRSRSTALTHRMHDAGRDHVQERGGKQVSPRPCTAVGRLLGRTTTEVTRSDDADRRLLPLQCGSWNW